MAAYLDRLRPWRDGSPSSQRGRSNSGSGLNTQFSADFPGRPRIVAAHQKIFRVYASLPIKTIRARIQQRTILS
jgi:hypothetical protein